MIRAVTTQKQGQTGRSGRAYLGQSVFDVAYQRVEEMYAAGHTVVVSFSGGKDSGICLELAVMAATATGRLPVHVIMRDEEIMFPGTFEYAERVAARPEIDFHWVYACQPIVNVFDRHQPYWWVFDPELDPSEWVRQPPPFAKFIEQKSITELVTPERFPVPDGKWLIDVTGLRVQESVRRTFSIASAKGALTKPQRPYGVRKLRPIYDWTDGDVWLAVQRFGWDYNSAYDVMARMGTPRNRLRIAPPTMTAHSVEQLRMGSQAWPRWWERVCDRVNGMHTAAQFGRRACQPVRRLGETWEDCFQRVCVDEAPQWIAERAVKVRAAYIQNHLAHSTAPFPESQPCSHCSAGKSLASWRKLVEVMYNGDPFHSVLTNGFAGLYPPEPEFFRPGSGTWGGKPSW